MDNLHSGSQFVFVKAVMEKFIKPFIDALISEPDKDPLNLYRMTNQDKPVLKENMSVKFDNKLNEKCNKCGQMCKGEHGLNIHISKMHTVKKVIVGGKRKFDNEKNIIDVHEYEEMCDVCGKQLASKEEFECHIKKCIAQRDAIHESRVKIPLHNNETNTVVKEV